MQKIKVKIKKLHPDAKIPIYTTPGSAAFDLYSVEQKIISAGDTVKVSTGIALEIEPGYCWQFWGRSGLSAKGIHRTGGLIDSDYRGEFIVILHNSTVQEFKIEKGDRIAQVLVTPAIQAEFQEVSELGETQRGKGGFESTGRN